MAKRTKTEIVLATWPSRNGADFLGDRDYGTSMSCDSMWLQLRQIENGDVDCYSSPETRAVRDIGVWVWIGTRLSDDGRGRVPMHNIELRLHDIHSLTVHEAEVRLKMLKRLTAKMPAPREAFSLHIQDVFAALGIKQSIQYRGMTKDVLAPVYEATPVIFSEFGRRFARCTS